MTDNTLEDEELVRLLGGRALRRRRLSRAVLARMLGEEGEGGEDEEEGAGEEAQEGSDTERRLIKLLIGSRMLKRRLLRRMLIAHLLHERAESEEDEGEEAEGEESSGQEGERRLLKLLIASRWLRRRRVRRALLAHLVRERAGAEEDEGEGAEEEEGGGEDVGEGSDKERRLVKLLIASRMLKRRRVRRALLAHLLREKHEEPAEEEA